LNKENVVIKPYFDKDTTYVIKGIALIMMFIHHFFTFPEWWIDGVDYPIIERFAIYLNEPLKICVSVFCFVTGYFYYFNKDKTYRYSIRKIVDIYINYWVVWVVLVLIAVVGVNYNYTINQLLLEALAIETPTMFFCWYVLFYIVCMLIFPLISRALTNNIGLAVLVSFVVTPALFAILGSVFVYRSALLGNRFNQLGAWMPIMLMGFIFARYDMFTRFNKIGDILIKNSQIRLALYFLVVLLVPMGRYFYPRVMISYFHGVIFYLSIDVIYAPIFVYCLVGIIALRKKGIIREVIIKIGQKSLLMWFLSCTFYNMTKEMTQKLLYLPRNPVLVLLWGLAICYFASVPLEHITSSIIRVKNKKL